MNKEYFAMLSSSSRNNVKFNEYLQRIWKEAVISVFAGRTMKDEEIACPHTEIRS
jgi:hypothetical protein